MIVTCEKCWMEFDDEFRWTFCPHETFAANDGHNNFAHKPESTLRRVSRVSTWLIAGFALGWLASGLPVVAQAPYRLFGTSSTGTAVPITVSGTNLRIAFP